MSSKFSVGNIVKDHFRTLRNFGTEKIELSSVSINFVLPAIIAAIFVYFVLIIRNAEFDVILTAFSVFAALLLNLMILLYSVLNRESEKKDEQKNKMKMRLLKETYSNIEFSVLTSVIIIVIILLMLFIPYNFYFDLTASFIVYYLIFVFITTLFMVLKRMHSIMSRL